MLNKTNDTLSLLLGIEPLLQPEIATVAGDKADEKKQHELKKIIAKNPTLDTHNLPRNFKNLLAAHRSNAYKIAKFSAARSNLTEQIKFLHRLALHTISNVLNEKVNNNEINCSDKEELEFNTFLDAHHHNPNLYNTQGVSMLPKPSVYPNVSENQKILTQTNTWNKTRQYNNIIMDYNRQLMAQTPTHSTPAHTQFDTNGNSSQDGILGPQSQPIRFPVSVRAIQKNRRNRYPSKRSKPTQDPIISLTSSLSLPIETNRPLTTMDSHDDNNGVLYHPSGDKNNTRPPVSALHPSEFSMVDELQTWTSMQQHEPLPLNNLPSRPSESLVSVKSPSPLAFEGGDLTKLSQTSDHNYKTSISPAEWIPSIYSETPAAA